MFRRYEHYVSHTHITVNLSLILDYNWVPSFMYQFIIMTHGENTRNTNLAPETVGLISATFRKTLHAEMILCLSSAVLARDKIS